MSEELIARELGGSGIRTTAVGLGTWAIGGWLWGGTDEASAIKAIQASVDAGVGMIDTAPVYGMGVSEQLVGRALEGRRDQVVLSTKCGLVWHTQAGTHFVDQAGKPVHRYLGKEAIIHEVEQSLRRLRTDYIDHYITHWQDPTTSISETMEAMEMLRRQGKIRSVGASNVSSQDLASYLEVGGLDGIQERYSMLDRGVEKELVPRCQSNSVSIVAYSPLALGLLSGKVGPEREFKGDDVRIDNPRFSVSNREKVAALLKEFEGLARDHHATVAQLVIAWTLQQPGIDFALCGARNPEQAVENARAGALRLSTDEIEHMSGAARRCLSQLDT